MRPKEAALLIARKSLSRNAGLDESSFKLEDFFDQRPDFGRQVCYESPLLLEVPLLQFVSFILDGPDSEKSQEQGGQENNDKKDSEKSLVLKQGEFEIFQHTVPRTKGLLDMTVA